MVSTTATLRAFRFSLDGSAVPASPAMGAVPEEKGSDRPLVGRPLFYHRKLRSLRKRFARV